MPIKLIVGLGNPGTEYVNTRHNAGFWLVERFAETVRVQFRSERGFQGEVAKAPKAWLLKPQTFMNRSGQSVVAIARFYKILPDEILVAHDELDLLPGVVKHKRGGGHAGHNGLRDIAASLGTPDFWRMRIGIGHPRSLNVRSEVADFVLHAPKREEQVEIDDGIERCLSVLPTTIDSTMEAAMMALHTKSG